MNGMTTLSLFRPTSIRRQASFRNDDFPNTYKSIFISENQIKSEIIITATMDAFQSFGKNFTYASKTPMNVDLKAASLPGKPTYASYPG